MRTQPPRPWHRTAALALAVLVLGPVAAQAKLSSKEWKALEVRFREVFAGRGEIEAKQKVMEDLASDDSGRAWRTMTEALFLEVQLWWGVQNEVSETTRKYTEILQKHKGGYTADEENSLKDLKAKLDRLDDELKTERMALDGVVTAVIAGPELLRKSIIKRAKSGSEWPYRAAAVRVAAATHEEKDSWSFLQSVVANDDDPRVRLAGLDAVASLADGGEDLVIGRLGDAHWSVVLRAVRLCKERNLSKAVPHLINALSRASPRLADAIGEALREMTKENFEPYPEVWAKWWADHQKEFESTVKVKGGKKEEFAKVDLYGVPVKSDRVLFIVDISHSMRLETKNKNPKAEYKPPPPTTGGGNRPPPPPPPEEIASGPKIDVARHEIKKAIVKLPETTTFNIICFNHGASYWKKTMQKATKKNKEEAYAWLRSLKPSGSTYIDGALRMGFEIAGLINYDKRYPDIHLDTIILLSDGAPTDSSFPVSKLMEPEVILQHVREWNKGKNVVIHCIGIDLQESIEFLRKLAEENGGTYVDR